MSQFKDFDLALAEREPDPDARVLEFQFGGERFTVQLPLAAGPLFAFITEGATVRGLRYLAQQIDFLAAVVEEDPTGELAAAVTAAEAKVDAARAAGEPDQLAAAESELTDTKANQIVKSGPRRLRAAIRNSKADIDFIDTICAYVCEGGTEAPLPASEPSSSEQQSTGDGSKADAPSAVSTSSPEAPVGL